jgi:hypothetical protein
MRVKKGMALLTSYQTGEELSRDSGMVFGIGGDGLFTRDSLE